MKGRRLIWKLLSLVVMVGVLLLLWYHDLLSPQRLISYFPDRPVAAVFLLLLFYCLKSLTLFFPVLVLQTAAGLLFSPWVAFTVNLAGTVLSICVSYGVGIYFDGSWLEQKMRRYPKLKNIVQKQKNNVFVLSLLLRIPGCFPMDVTGAYLGMFRLNFQRYFWGSLLGLIPHVLLGTFLGITMRQPGSLGFWITIGLLVCFALLSGILFRLRHKHDAE